MLTQSDSAPTQSKRNGNSALRLRAWAFTWHNYTLDSIDSLIYKLKDYEYVFQEETGELTNKKHLQGFVRFPNQRYLSSLTKMFPGCHFEPARNEEALTKYCQKEETRTGKTYSNLKPEKKPLRIFSYDQLYEWQKNIVDMCKTEPDDRSIYWYWEPEGNIGKTQLIKHIVYYFKNATYACCSKSADILTLADENINIYLLNFVRTSDNNFAPYTAIEQLKDGLISDSKLKKKTRNILMNSPHVICFANWPPKIEALSKDHWKVTNLSQSSNQKTCNRNLSQQLSHTYNCQNHSQISQQQDMLELEDSLH